MKVGKFEQGEEVYIYKLHYSGAHGTGYVLKLGTESPNIGKYYIDIGISKIYIEPERVLSLEEYKQRMQDETNKFYS